MALIPFGPAPHGTLTGHSVFSAFAFQAYWQGSEFVVRAPLLGLSRDLVKVKVKGRTIVVKLRGPCGRSATKTFELPKNVDAFGAKIAIETSELWVKAAALVMVKAKKKGKARADVDVEVAAAGQVVVKRGGLVQGEEMVKVAGPGFTWKYQYYMYYTSN